MFPIASQLEKNGSLPVWYHRRAVKNVGRSISAILLTICSMFFALSILALTFKSFFAVDEADDANNVHLLMPATQVTPRFCKTLASVILNDYPNIVVTNWHGDTHHRAKIFSTLEYLEKNVTEADDVVIVIDAYDTLAQQPLANVLEAFHKQDADIVFSAEKGCHPPSDGWCDGVPDSPLPKLLYGPNTDLQYDLTQNRPRWLNSGFVVGRAHALKKLYTAAAQMAVELDGNFIADQSIFGPLFVNDTFGITLDYASTMAQPMYFYEREAHFAAESIRTHDLKGAMRSVFHSVVAPTSSSSSTPVSNDKVDDIPIWRLRNLATDSTPAFIHFNLPDKAVLDDHWSTFWYGGQNGLDVVRAARQYADEFGSVRRATDGVAMRYRDMCRAETWGR